MNLPFRQLRKLVILILGGSVLLVGVILLVAPGPAFLVIPAGLAILAIEFEWARRLLKKARVFYESQTEAWKRKPENQCRAVFVTAQGTWTVEGVTRARTPWQRFRGLMAQPPPGSGRGLFLAPCGSIHTCFMRFDLDLVFVSRAGRVVRVVRSVKPWRIAWGGRGAWGVLELQAGWFPCGELAPGVRMALEGST